MDLTVSERVLIAIKAFGLMGEPSVTLGDLIEALLISEDILDQQSFTITYEDWSGLTAPAIEGSLEILEKMALVKREKGGFVLTERGEVFLSSKLSSLEALTFLRVLLEVIKLSRPRRRLYSLLVAYRAVREMNKVFKELEQGEDLEDAYKNYKRRIKEEIMSTKLSA